MIFLISDTIFQINIKESTPLTFVRTTSLRSGSALVQNNDTIQLNPHAKIKVSNTSAVVKFYPDMSQQLKFACAGLGNEKYEGFAGQFVVQYDVQRDAQGGEVCILKQFYATLRLLFFSQETKSRRY